ncbi:hypothetical protein [Lacticaseibacillus sp. GG6-2]
MHKISTKAKMYLGLVAIVVFAVLTVAAKTLGQTLLWQIFMGCAFIAIVITFDIWRAGREA